MTSVEMIIAKAKEIHVDWDALISPPFKASEVLEILRDLCDAAELVCTAKGTGKFKHAVVKEAFDVLDKELKLVDVLGKLIPLPVFLKPFKSFVVKHVIDILIKAIVAGMNLFLKK